MALSRQSLKFPNQRGDDGRGKDGGEAEEKEEKEGDGSKKKETCLWDRRHYSDRLLKLYQLKNSGDII
jgi:hypothetical protein